MTNINLTPEQIKNLEPVVRKVLDENGIEVPAEAEISEIAQVTISQSPEDVGTV